MSAVMPALHASRHRTAAEPRTRRPSAASRETESEHVLRHRGEFAGRVTRTPEGRFVAFDAEETPIGLYRDLREAKRAVRDVARGVTWAEPPRFARVAQSLATVTGLIAAALLVAASVGELPTFL